jgi:hypothetical protein
MLAVETNFVKLLEDLKTSIEKIGIEGTIEAFNSYGDYLENSGLKEMEIITSVVCDVYETTRKELMDGRTRDGKRIAALEAAMYIMAYHYKIPKTVIGSFFKKHITNVSRYSKEVFYYNKEYKLDCLKIEKLNSVKKQLDIETNINEK